MPRHYLLRRPEVLQGSRRESKPRFETGGRYNIDAPPSATGIVFNGEGWDASDWTAAPVVVLAVDGPQFVELTVGPRFTGERASAGREVYRAQMCGVELPLENVSTEGDVIRVHFGVPEAIRQRHETELLFVCFINGCDSQDRVSQRMLHAVRWR